MKLGLSSYSLYQEIQAGKMTILDALQWSAENGAEHMEIVPFGFSLVDQPDVVDAIVNKAKEVGIELSNYSIGANFIQPSEEAYELEIARVMREVDIANALGVKLMRHDVASRPMEETSVTNYYTDLPRLIEACQRIADHASTYGITTSVENHGYYIQHSDRVQALVQGVNRENFRTTLDVGNFMCADENSVAAVKNNLPIASVIHLKDFYLRPANQFPGEGWFPTLSGNYLRGAIVGQGDIDMWEVISVIKKSGYDGYISIEFEGLEPCTFGSKAGLDNARRIWNAV
ncbi:sugar phosphate isomerase [Paenibacillus baekrokdamisoli]|uniref:Sugar phosphate isomerase n=1 Tax=Paenibacillus baekrokdamisoli TaxID=1712516 RepID=A0A3G9J7A7_9BACL|nr:sugar phosphate isomerase/epimerase family protein [Paenibacillus baekrokdamisoli]MBB3069176.1 sugar phosphate isomerase/epimerase [Paenibacillus baekrokdamisoli]BBH18849.1 sugar phosphate isomerase [Paenibacillus baekrokdamisoli]